jgi:hypothetical protein
MTYLFSNSRTTQDGYPVPDSGKQDFAYHFSYQKEWTLYVTLRLRVTIDSALSFPEDTQQAVLKKTDGNGVFQHDTLRPKLPHSRVSLW